MFRKTLGAWMGAALIAASTLACSQSDPGVTTAVKSKLAADDVVKSFLQHTRAGDLGLNSPDDRFTVIEVECLGACGFPTPVMINEEFIDSVTPETVPEILARLP